MQKAVRAVKPRDCFGVIRVERRCPTLDHRTRLFDWLRKRLRRQQHEKPDEKTGKKQETSRGTLPSVGGWRDANGTILSRGRAKH